jgi:SNF2 family DNA or RNA helicase
MSGTPILNKPQELFPLLHLILPEIFVTERDFLNLYCTQDMYTGFWKFANGGLARMMAHLSGRYLVRDRYTAGVEIPQQTMQIHELTLCSEDYPQQVHFSKMLSKHAQIILSSGKKIEALAAITLILRKRQMNTWPGGIVLKDAEGAIVFSVGEECNESIKVDKCCELIQNAGTERVVVFSQFKTPLHEIKKRLSVAGISAVVFDGDTAESIREQIKIDFDRKSAGETPKWQVVLCNFKTGGVGLNFTAATQMVVLDEEWNPGKNEQAYGRIDRVGQTQETTVHILRVRYTIDTWMANLIDQKKTVVDGMDQTGADLTKDILQAMRNGEV